MKPVYTPIDKISSETLRDPKSVYLRMETGNRYDAVFCFKYPRTVARDNTVAFDKRIV